LKVIDLFAGPGGLSEGFAGCGEKKFKIVLSIEKEKDAHQTLKLRSFFRQFPDGNAPDEYYQFLRGELVTEIEKIKNSDEIAGITDKFFEILKSEKKFKKQIDAAERETQHLELGKASKIKVYKKIRDALDGDECVLIGGPPCQAYSLLSSGLREAIRDKERRKDLGGKQKPWREHKKIEYEDKVIEKSYLYKEYLNIVAKFQPVVFVMENVKGLLSVKVNGEKMIDSIINDLKNPGAAIPGVKPDGVRKRQNYEIFSFVINSQRDLFGDSSIEPPDFVIRSEEYGIPQTRHRVILLGVRKDYCHKNINLLNKSDDSPTVEDVISDLPRLRSYISNKEYTRDQWKKTIARFRKEYLPAIKKEYCNEKSMLKEFKKNLTDFSVNKFPVGQELGMQKRKEINKKLSPELKKWYSDKKMKDFVVNHTVRSHMQEDLYRYFFSAVYTKIKNISPRVKEFPRKLLPKHKNLKNEEIPFVDRFRVQNSRKPATTITSHISKDGHYFIHYDPIQCRSLTVREAARIQTFPDNYFFAGSRTEQYIQVGNAVPPFLARQLAEIVHAIVSK